MSSSDRQTFTREVVRAIKELELRRSSKSQQELADTAWDKLQYDLPVLETAELQALLQQLRSSLHGKDGWPGYLITQKALENIVAGAKRSTSFAATLSEDEQHLRQLYDKSIALALLAASSHSSSSSSSSSAVTTVNMQRSHDIGTWPAPRHTAEQQQQQQQQQQGPPAAADCVTEQELYQQLCAAVLLQYMLKVVTLPEHNAWQLLEMYHPEQCDDDNDDDDDDDDDDREQRDQEEFQQQQQQQLDVLMPSAAAAAAVCDPLTSLSSEAATTPDVPRCKAAGPPGGDLSGGSANSHTHCSVYTQQEASVADEDGDLYDELDSVSHPQQQPHKSALRCKPATAGSHQHQQLCAPLYNWPQLQQKLLSLASKVHYSLLSYAPLWSQQGAAQQLLQLVRAVGVHTHHQELRPVLHAYVGVLLDRLAAAPAQLPLLSQLWDALGITGDGNAQMRCGASQPGTNQRQVPQQQQQQQALLSSLQPWQQLPTEAVLALSASAQLWQQLPSSTAQGVLWGLLHQNLMPLLEQCTEQLAYTSSSSSRKGPGNSRTRQEYHQHAVQDEGSVDAGDCLAHVLLAAHVVELLVVGRPSGVDVAGDLTAAGVTRNMVQLFVMHAGNSAAEPLRRALLLLCCSSASTAAWVLAVPAIVGQLQQQHFQFGGLAEAHGALWQMLPLRTLNDGRLHTGALAAGGLSSQSQQNLTLLLQQFKNNGLVQVQKAIGCLQLMVDVQNASKQQRVWSEQITGVLRGLASELKDVITPAVESGAHASGSLKIVARDDSAAVSNIGAAVFDVVDKDDFQASKYRQPNPKPASPTDLVARQAHQLQPMALKLIKQLLNQGGKTD